MFSGVKIKPKRKKVTLLDRKEKKVYWIFILGEPNSLKQN